MEGATWVWKQDVEGEEAPEKIGAAGPWPTRGGEDCAASPKKQEAPRQWQ